MRFTLRSLLLATAAICAALGSYRQGIESGYRRGYTDAREREQAILRSWAGAGKPEYGYKHWDDLGKWLREGPVGIIRAEPWNE